MTIEEEGIQFLNDGALTITLTAPNGVRYDSLFQSG